MNVSAVAITVPLIDNPTVKTAEDLIVYTARVSNPTNQEDCSTGAGLLRYCLRKRHWSPFEGANLTLEINTTRDIGRQILRHRSLVFQEFSARYANIIDSGMRMDVLRPARMQDTKNRQSSYDTDDAALAYEWEQKQLDVSRLAEETYKWATDKGIAKEVARAVTPEGMTESRIYACGSVRNWITYIALREGYGTQEEHRLVAVECKKVFCQHFPVIAEALGGADAPWGPRVGLEEYVDPIRLIDLYQDMCIDNDMLRYAEPEYVFKKLKESGL